MYDDAEEGPVTLPGCDAPPLGALDLLAVASRAAARIACEQSIAVEAAARLLECAAASETTVWVLGDAADEHTRRLESAGHRALTLLDPSRLPHRLRRGDVLFVATVAEIPTPLLAEARRRGVDVIALTGMERLDPELGVTISAPCRDERAIELTHGFIVTALCSTSIGCDQAESAA